jgi:predicted ATPase
LDLVASLVEQSLLVPERGLEGEPRFRMLETIREFALEQLLASGEADTIRRAHADVFLSLAERLEFAALLPDGQRLLARLEEDHANLRAVLAWFDEAGQTENLTRLAGALGSFWFAHSH